MAVSPRIDHTDQIEEDFIYVGVCLGRSLFESAAQFCGESLALLAGHLSFIFRINLVSYKNDWDIEFLFVRSEDVRSKFGGSFKTCHRGDAIHQNKPLPCLHVLISKSRIFFLSSSIHDIKNASSTIDLNKLSVRVFNCWIIFLYEVSLNETNREGLFLKVLDLSFIWMLRGKKEERAKVSKEEKEKRMNQMGGRNDHTYRFTNSTSTDNNDSIFCHFSNLILLWLYRKCIVVLFFATPHSEFEKEKKLECDEIRMGKKEREI